MPTRQGRQGRQGRGPVGYAGGAGSGGSAAGIILGSIFDDNIYSTEVQPNEQFGLAPGDVDFNYSGDPSYLASQEFVGLKGKPTGKSKKYSASFRTENKLADTDAARELQYQEKLERLLSNLRIGEAESMLPIQARSATQLGDIQNYQRAALQGELNRLDIDQARAMSPIRLQEASGLGDIETANKAKLASLLSQNEFDLFQKKMPLELQKAQDLSDIDLRSRLSYLGSVNDEEVAKARKMLPIQRESAQDQALAQYYGSRGGRTNPVLEGGAEDVIAHAQTNEIQRSRQANELSQALFPSQRRAALNTAMEEANRTGVRLNASYTQPGRDAIHKGYIGEQLNPAARTAALGRSNLGIGDVSYQDFAEQLGVSPFNRGASMVERPVMTVIPNPKGGPPLQVPSGASTRSTQFPAGGVGRITQADIDALNGTVPAPIQPPATAPPNAAMRNAQPQPQPQQLSPGLMQQTGNFGFNMQNPANPAVWAQKLMQLLQYTGGGIEDFVRGVGEETSPPSKQHTDALEAIKRRRQQTK